MPCRRCLGWFSGISPKNRSKKSRKSLGMLREPNPPTATVDSVSMFTTAGLSFSARSTTVWLSILTGPLSSSPLVKNAPIEGAAAKRTINPANTINLGILFMIPPDSYLRGPTTDPPR